MKRIYLLFSLLMAASFVSGQTTLQGIVVDASSHRPISFVSVSVKGSHSGFFDGNTTDANGRYSVANLPAGTFDSLANATSFIRTIQHRQGLNIGCPEEIAWRMGFIDDDGLRARAEPLAKSGYGTYLLGLLDRGRG